MKIKTIYYSSLVILFTLVSSCIDDKGNYDYQDEVNVMGVEISDLPDTVITDKQVILTPTLKKMKDGVEYSYRWFCYYQKSQGSGISSEIIELGTDKNLNVFLPLEPESYFLVFEVKDVKANIFVRKKMHLAVQATKIQVGYCLLKDMDNFTDFDYIDTNNNDQLYSDVLKNYSTGDLRLPGKAVQFVFQPGQYTHQIIEDGKVVKTLNNQKVFHIASEQQYHVVHATTMNLFKKFNDAFYETPSVIKLQALDFNVSNSGGVALLNNGKMHTINKGSTNIGLLNSPDVIEAEYEFAATRTIPSTTYALAFDKRSKAFKKVAFVRGIISSYTDKVIPPGVDSATVVSPNKMNADLIELMPARVEKTGTATVVTAVALLKSTTKSEHYLAMMDLTNISNYPFTRIDTIPDASAQSMLTSPYRAATREGNFIYYTKGNELRSYNFNIAPIGQRDNLVMAYPSGETVTCILNYYLQTSPTTGTNHLFVATSTADGKWKMYRYLILSAGDPTVNPTPDKTYEGRGVVREIIFKRARS